MQIIVNRRTFVAAFWGYIMCFSVCYLFDVSLLNELYWHLGDINMNMTLDIILITLTLSLCWTAISFFRAVFPPSFFSFTHSTTIGQTVILLCMWKYLAGGELFLNGNLISKYFFFRGCSVMWINEQTNRSFCNLLMAHYATSPRPFYFVKKPQRETSHPQESLYI